VERAVHGPLSLAASRDEHDRAFVAALLRATEGDLDEAAQIAQVHRKSLERIIRRQRDRSES
jgi:hypothetical protein